MDELKIYEFDGDEWWLGHSVEEIVPTMCGYYGLESMEFISTRELPDADLDRFKYINPDNSVSTFRDRLQKELQKDPTTPRIFSPLRNKTE